MNLSGLTLQELNALHGELNLTEDEDCVFHYLSRGKSIVEIAGGLNMSPRAIDQKIKNIKKKIERVGDAYGIST